MPAISRILCPIDFSDTSSHAVEQASAIARWYGARITVLHVADPMFLPVPGSETDCGPDEEIARVRKEAAVFADTVGRSSACTDIAVEFGHPAALIVDRARGLSANLIVMGTHGASGFQHLLLGSVTEKVLRKATCPVLTVPPRAHATSQFPFRRILCAVDFSEWSCAGLALASSLAGESGASLALLHVLEWPWHEPPPPVFAALPAEQAAALIEFRRYLVTTATSRLESLMSPTVRDRCVMTASVTHGKPYVELLKVAADDEADLIVLGVHSRGALDLTVFGSTTNQVIRRATCPVLTLRA